MSTPYTSRERIRKILSLQEPDRIGLADTFWTDTLTRWRGEGLPADADPGALFGFDFDHLYMDASFRLPERLIEETDEYTVREDKHGFVAKQWKGRDGALGYLEHAIKTRADWDRLKERLAVDFGGTSRIHSVSYFTPFVIYPSWEASATAFVEMRRNERYTLLTVYGPFESTWRKRGFAETLMDIAAEPTWVAEMAQAHVDLVIATLGRAEQCGIKPDGIFLIEDLGMNTGPLFAPRAYDRIFFPQHQRLGAYFREHGIDFFMHCDGDIRLLIPRLLSAGVQVLQPLEAKSNLDVRELKRQYGDRLVMMGNIDTRKMSGSRAELAQEVESKVTAAKQGGGFIYHSDHSVPPTVSWDNYRYLMELLDTFGRYSA